MAKQVHIDLPSQEILKYKFDIDRNGNIRHRSTGNFAGTQFIRGGLRIHIDGHYVSAKRVAWKYHTGCEPPRDVLFVNPNRKVYLLENLTLRDKVVPDPPKLKGKIKAAGT